MVLFERGELSKVVAEGDDKLGSVNELNLGRQDKLATAIAND
jgi:hypothetical protein